MQHTMSAVQRQQALTQIADRAIALAAALLDEGDPATLDRAVATLSQHFGQALIPLVLTAWQPPSAPLTTPCPCGDQATYQRRRSAQVTTLLGPVTYTRPVYHCPTCRHGLAPLDQALHWCAGRPTPALRARLALLGVTCPFAEAAAVLTELTGVTVSPTVIQQVTEAIGHPLADAPPESDPVLGPPPQGPLYISMDGVMIHLAEEGWKEVRVGAVYTTNGTGSALSATGQRYVVECGDLATFGARLWAAAARAGAETAREVVVIGDGAAWIWNLAREYWPRATHLVDWFHATQHLWTAANARYGEGQPAARAWEQELETALWRGQVNAVLDALQAWAWKYPAVAQTATYFAHHRDHMAYAAARERGRQVGSGCIESACKQVVQARMKRAGMIWTRAGARAVLALRARFLSGDWAATMAAAPPPHRGYHRRVA